MVDARAQFVALVRRDLALARAAARVRLGAAQESLRSAQTRLAQTRTAAARSGTRAAETRDELLRQAAARQAADSADLAARAAAAAEQAAPGAAGADWPQWKANPAARGEPQGPLRVGEFELDGCPPVPALVPLLDRAHLAVRGDDPAACDAVVAAVLLRALGRTTPGTVRLTGYDPEQLGGGLAGFAPLAPAGLLTFVGPGGLGRLLDELVDHIRRINETVLAGAYASVRELAEAEGRRPEPWRVAVLLAGPDTTGEGDELSRHERAQLDRVLRTGVACGVHLVIRGLAVPDMSTVENIAVAAGSARLGRCGGLTVRLDPPPPAGLVTATCRDLAAAVTAGPTPAVFADLIPERLWTHRSPAGLTAPLGDGVDGRPVEVTLADYPPHALIGGPSGTGKTNLIYAWIGALAARYPPSELEFYLLDFKEGVSFARFAPGRRDPTWLPQVRLVGVNVNTDREFGLALLRFLAAELRRRADAAKRYEVTKLEELRAEAPDERWPRIVAVIDEFQVLLAGRDPLATEAATLLEDLARRGRSQGIHLVLASQDVSGIEALWGRHGLVAQFTLRIALPKARRILAEANTAAETLPRHHAVVNADSGALAANQVVLVPAAGDRPAWAELQGTLWRRRPPGLPPPRLFDGDAVPLLSDAPDYLALGTEPGAGAGAHGAGSGGRGAGAGGCRPVALLGETIDVEQRAARLALPRLPGRNLAVLGTRIEEACAILGAAAMSLARQYAPGSARFSVACLDSGGLDTGAVAAARRLHAALPDGTGWYDVDSVTDLLADTATGLDEPGPPHFLVLYAVDAAYGQLAAKTPRGFGHQDLRRILHAGPERHVHVLGWWRGVARLRDDLGGIGAARYDTIGAWVALDVHGGELMPPLYPKAGGPPWYPRPWRALFFDRAVHRTADVIIPYGLS